MPKLTVRYLVVRTRNGGEEQAEHGEGFVGIDGQGAVGGGEGFGDGDEVEEGSG